MASRFALQSLLEHARHRMEAAERLMVMIKRKEEAAQVKLTELEGYRQEYQLRLENASRSGIGIHILMDYRLFLEKLDQAIRNQGNEAVQLKGRWQAAQDNWMILRQKVQAYQVLETRHVQTEELRQNRREQRQTDELAGRKAAAERLVDQT